MTAPALLAPTALGSITPRLHTPPLVTGVPGPCGCGCALSDATSYGFRATRFADEILGRPLWPWQRWLAIHAGELRPDGIPRFRRVLVTVGRQSGKSETVLAMTLYWLFEERQPSILGTSTLTKYAKKPWMSAFKAAISMPKLAAQMPENPHRKAIRRAAGEEEWWTLADCHYAIAASNAEGGRSMTNQRVIADEFAKQYNYDAYGAAYYSMDAVEDAQYFALTTPDPKGEPYCDLRGSALAFIDTGEGDESLGLFEWSAPEDADPTDVHALAMANPTMNRPGGKSGDRLVREARGHVVKGGRGLETFKQDIMCIQTIDSSTAIDLLAWARQLVPGSLDGVRDRIALVFDVAPSMKHATLYAAATLPDGRIRVDPVEAWDGAGCADRAARELPALVARIRPRAFGWVPGADAAAVAAHLKDRSMPGRRDQQWPPPGVAVEEIRSELTAVCMGFAELVVAGRIVHSGDPLLDGDVAGAQRLKRGDAWVFSRKGEGDCDALYAAAGAAYLAQILPPPKGRIRIVT